MRTSITLATIVAFVVSPVLAQTGGQAGTPRVRISAADKFIVPNLLSVDANRIEGPALVDSDSLVVHARFTNPERVVTIPRPGTQLTGVAIALEGDVLSLRLDNRPDVIFVPAQAIRGLEIRTQAAPRHHRVLWTVLAGVGSFWVSTAIAFSRCFLGPCSDAWNVFIFGFTGGITAGTAYALRNDRWEAISLADLSKRLSGITTGPLMR